MAPVSPEHDRFEAGGKLYLMDLSNQQYKPVTVNVVSDLAMEMPTSKDVTKGIRNMTAAPEGRQRADR